MNEHWNVHLLESEILLFNATSIIDILVELNFILFIFEITVKFSIQCHAIYNDIYLIYVGY